MWPNCKNTKIKLRASRNWNFRKNVMNNFDQLNNLFPRPREEIINMQSYSAPLENRRNLLRLDFNENTLGPSPNVFEALQGIKLDEISIYPEYNY